jgi:Meiotically up-regulated gene 113
MSSVYLMKNMANGYYKIGSSSRPHIRERTLQAQEPDIRLLASIEADRRIERALHHRYTVRRVRGEWFALHYGDLCELREDFSVELEKIDPPVEVIIGDWWRAAIYRYSPVCERTWVTWYRGEFCLRCLLRCRDVKYRNTRALSLRAMPCRGDC